MDNIVEKIIQKLRLDPDYPFKKPIRGYSGFTIEEAITAIIYTKSLKEASSLLGYSSDGPIKQFTCKILMPKFPDKTRPFGTQVGKSNWRFDLLEIVQHKHCCTCNRILPFIYFGAHKNNDSTGLAGQCLNCRVYISKQQKLDIIKRTPSWANIEKIKQIYLECPLGHHVDHIIPLRGKEVSGFHIENNLQYLPALENISKGNKYTIQ